MNELKRKRLAAVLSLNQLAERSGVARTTLSLAENRNLTLLPYQQRAVDRVLARCVRERLRTLERMAGTAEEMTS